MKKNNKINAEPVKESEKSNTGRRTFLKKTVYAAPTLIALGYLFRPKKAHAGHGKPPSGPDWP